MQLDEQTFDEIATEAFYDEMSKLGYDEDAIDEIAKEAGVKAIYGATKDTLKAYGKEMAAAGKQIWAGAKQAVGKPSYMKSLTRKQKKNLSGIAKDQMKKTIKISRKAGRAQVGAGLKNKAMRNTLIAAGGTAGGAGALTGAYQIGKRK